MPDEPTEGPGAEFQIESAKFKESDELNLELVALFSEILSSIRDLYPPITDSYHLSLNLAGLLRELAERVKDTLFKVDWMNLLIFKIPSAILRYLSDARTASAKAANLVGDNISEGMIMYILQPHIALSDCDPNKLDSEDAYQQVLSEKLLDKFIPDDETRGDLLRPFLVDLLTRFVFKNIIFYLTDPESLNYFLFELLKGNSSEDGLQIGDENDQNGDEVGLGGSLCKINTCIKREFEDGTVSRNYSSIPLEDYSHISRYVYMRRKIKNSIFKLANSGKRLLKNKAGYFLPIPMPCAKIRHHREISDLEGVKELNNKFKRGRMSCPEFPFTILNPSGIKRAVLKKRNLNIHRLFRHKIFRENIYRHVLTESSKRKNASRNDTLLGLSRATRRKYINNNDNLPSQVRAKDTGISRDNFCFVLYDEQNNDSGSFLSSSATYLIGVKNKAELNTHKDKSREQNQSGICTLLDTNDCFSNNTILEDELGNRLKSCAHSENSYSAPYGDLLSYKRLNSSAFIARTCNIVNFLKKIFNIIKRPVYNPACIEKKGNSYLGEWIFRFIWNLLRASESKCQTRLWILTIFTSFVFIFLGKYINKITFFAIETLTSEAYMASYVRFLRGRLFAYKYEKTVDSERTTTKKEWNQKIVHALVMERISPLSLIFGKEHMSSVVMDALKYLQNVETNKHFAYLLLDNIMDQI